MPYLSHANEQEMRRERHGNFKKNEHHVKCFKSRLPIAREDRKNHYYNEALNPETL